MEFNKILTRFTVCAIVVLFAVTFVCTCITIINRGEDNINMVKTFTSTENCTQIAPLNC